MPRLGLFPASGQLGTSIRNHLISITEPKDVVLISRYPDKTPSNFASVGVTLREADYDRPESLDGALADISHLVLISYPGLEVEHRNKV